jgi:RNA polymerase sigma-70 factor (sigma-E family)
VADPPEEDFRAFVQTRRQPLVRTAYLLTGDSGDAEDLVQMVLAKAYTSWRKVVAADQPDAYVRRMLVNAHLSLHRRRRVTQLLTSRTPDRPVPDGTGRIAERSALAAALDRLPARQRAVVVLRYWEDLPEGQVAQALNCAVGTVRSQAHKGLKALRNDPKLADFAPVEVPT